MFFFVLFKKKKKMKWRIDATVKEQKKLVGELSARVYASAAKSFPSLTLRKFAADCEKKGRKKKRAGLRECKLSAQTKETTDLTLS